jgi:nucleoside-diphosphate-sugar epimerase
MMILVTGASGFVGQAVIEALLSRGMNVLGTTTDHESCRNLDALEWVVWDSTIAALPIPERKFEQFDAVVHLAAPRNRKGLLETAGASYSANVEATFNLLRAASQSGCHFIFASSGDVFAGGSAYPVESETCYSPSSFYGATKAAAELIIKPFSQQYSTTVLRLFHPFGPGGDRFLINKLFLDVLNDETITIDSGHGIMLNPVWIDDLADGVARTVERKATGIFHLSGPKTYSIKEIILQMGDLSGRKPNVIQTNASPPGGHAGSCELATELLGYQPATNLRQGLTKLYSKYR